jgi:hypothetical protein
MIAMTALLADYMDEAEFSKEIGKAQVTVRKMRARGKGPPYVKLGGTILYKRTDAASWLLSLTRKPPRERRV